MPRPLALVALLAVACHAQTPQGPGALARPTDRRIDSLARAFVGTQSPGLSVLVSRNGGVIHRAGYGLANVEQQVPATPETNYRTGSVGKPFTAQAVLRLAERGRLSLDDPIARFLPRLPAWGNQVSVRHLLSHTGGIVDYGFLMSPGLAQPLTDAAVLELLRTVDTTVTMTPGRYRYSNSGYVLLALIVEAAAGMPFERYVIDSIARPAGMRGTTYYPREDLAPPRARAFGYSRTDSGFRRTDQSMSSSIRGDGSLYQSVDDLFRWDQAMHAGRPVGPSSLAASQTASAWNTAGTTGYGYGWFVSEFECRRVAWHGGITIGFQSAVWRSLTDRFTVIVLMNGGGDGSRMFDLVAQIVKLYLPDCPPIKR